MNLLLDTNTLIDYLGRKPPFAKPMQHLLAAGYFGDTSLWVPAQSMKDAFFVLDRYLDSLKIQRAMVALCEVVHPVSLTAEDAIRAAKLEWDDYEDCLIALAAEKVKADYLITRDRKGFSRSMVPTLSPQEWLTMMEKDRGLVYEDIGPLTR